MAAPTSETPETSATPQTKEAPGTVQTSGTPRSSGMPRLAYSRNTRPVLLLAAAGAAVWLAPWTAYLAGSLPDRYNTHQWRLAWVGFDIGLLCCFATAAWLGLRRHRAAVPALVATAALMCCDAWFDVMLDWNGSDRWASVAMAALAEVPLAVLLLLRARWLIVSVPPGRVPSVADIDEVLTDPLCRRVFEAVGGGEPLRLAELSAVLELPGDVVAARLALLARAGQVRRVRGGRWRAVPQSLYWPDLDQVSPADRERYVAFLDAKYEDELKLLERAARVRDTLGRWGKGSRATAHLTAAELARFNNEYHELLFRYGMMRETPAPGTREVALRFYAFPRNLDERWSDEPARG